MASDFICADCGQLIICCYSRQPPDDSLCVECRFIRRIKDKADRDTARDILKRMVSQWEADGGEAYGT